MDKPDKIPQRYQWPWLVLAMLVLGGVIAIIWMCYAVQQERQERDFNTPLPGGAAR